jgi:hypothetical protein
MQGDVLELERSAHDDVWLQDDALFTDMTAIALAYTDEGFVIAADGRLRLLDDDNRAAFGSREGWAERKIFNDVLGGKDIVWAMSGQAYSADRRQFNLVEEIHKAINAASIISSDTTLHVPAFASLLRSSLSALNKTVFFRDSEIPLATIIIGGYFGRSGIPVRAVVQLFHQKGDWIEPEVATRIHLPLETCVGSEKIYKCYIREDGDNPLRKYFWPTGPTLEDGLACAKGYVDACCDPLAETIDPGISDRIGGHIHAAALTPSGFQWLIEPKPEGTA